MTPLSTNDLLEMVYMLQISLDDTLPADQRQAVLEQVKSQRARLAEVLHTLRAAAVLAAPDSD